MKVQLPHPAPTLAEIQAARQRLGTTALRTPLVRLSGDDLPAEIYLKLENLQPIGSFKLRGAGNAIAMATNAQLRNGVWTASAGNMALGVAWHARRRGISCTVVVPDHAPRAKLDAIERLGAKIISVPFGEWWQILVTGKFEGLEGLFVHPVIDPAVIAGNGTIGLEILEDLADVEAILVPYGGGGLVTGIGCALRALKPSARLYACEVETAAPLAASLRAGVPTPAEYTPSFVDGIGGKTVLAEMWPVVKQLVDDSLVASLAQVSAAIRLLVMRNRIVAEGAGAASVAAALGGTAGKGKLVCIVSGGNIDPAKLANILHGDVPS